MVISNSINLAAEETECLLDVQLISYITVLSGRGREGDYPAKCEDDIKSAEMLM